MSATWGNLPRLGFGPVAVFVEVRKAAKSLTSRFHLRISEPSRIDWDVPNQHKMIFEASC